MNDFSKLNVEALLKKLGIKARRGANKWEAACPNPSHNDGRASWYIRDEPGSEFHGYHSCLGCGMKGGVVKLVGIVMALEPGPAIDWLKLVPADVEEVPDRLELTVANPSRGETVFPPGVRFPPPEDWDPEAYEYIHDDRKVTDEQIVRWGIGYALAGELAGRIVIPVRDRRDYLVSYTARSWTGTKAKYKEPKGREHAVGIFGEQHWPEKRSTLTVFVCEGAFNALAVERALSARFAAAGVPEPCVAALMGSSLHPSQVVKLSQFQDVTICVDGDEAGDKAHAALVGALKRSVNEIKRLVLPAGKDCNDLPQAELCEQLVRLWSVKIP